jgi:hypothetical protein
LYFLERKVSTGQEGLQNPTAHQSLQFGLNVLIARVVEAVEAARKVA